MNPGDRIIVTMPRSAPREGEYVEDRGSRARVLLDGDTETCVVLRERVKLHAGQTFLKRAASLSPESQARLMDAFPLPEPRPVPKPPKPDRDAKYLAFVRKQLCAVCAFTHADCAHHHGPRGMGQKCSDYLAVPLCNEHHREFHDTGTCFASTRAELDRDFARAQLGCLAKWCAERDVDATTIMRDALIAHLRENQT